MSESKERKRENALQQNAYLLKEIRKTYG